MKVQNNWEQIFNDSCELLFSSLQENEVLNANFSGEETAFVRFNHAKVRQATEVEQGSLSLELKLGQKKADFSLGLSPDANKNKTNLSLALKRLQGEVRALPDDPFVTDFEKGGESRTINEGRLPSTEEFLTALKETVGESDLAGYLTMGTSFRGNANSLGQKHWFESTSFFFDYSLYTAKEKAVKGSYAGTHFSQDELKASLDESLKGLSVMDRPQKVLEPGKYRVYLAPGAVHEVSGLLGWHALSGGAYKRGECPLGDLYEGKRSFSDKVTLKENFKLGLSPRFNEWGEVASEELKLVEKGKMETLLVSRETEKEYGLSSNKASGFEGPRSLDIETGDLKRDEVLKELGTGLYISNLHYLNWSDKPKGRMTGMTRFGCLWVENGEVVGPIKDLRFDETLYQIFGEGLERLTDFSEVMMETSTYGERSIGGSRLPGLIVNDFTFTL